MSGQDVELRVPPTTTTAARVSGDKYFICSKKTVASVRKLVTEATCTRIC